MTANPSVLIIGDDAADLAKLVHDAAPSIDLTTAIDARGATSIYSDQTVLFGSPDLVAEVLPGMPDVQWVQSTWAGVKPLIDLGRRDYMLTGIKDVFGAQISEYVLGYLLAHELKIVRRLDEQRHRNWWPGESGVLSGKQLGVLGAGSIGSAIASKARALGLHVLGLSRSGTEMPEFDSVYPPTHIAEFLGKVDYLVSVLPDTPATDKMLNADTLAMMQPHAVFVNVGRGNVVDDVALVDALAEGRLAAAVLDVFDEEPVPRDSALWDAPNLLMTAHMAAVSRPELIAPIFLDNYRRFLSGRDLLHVISFADGY